MGRWWPLVAVCLGAFMLLVDVTIVVVALPVVGTDLAASLTDLQWVLNAYALTLAALLMATGTLADRFGRRRIYLAGLVGFAAASLACGLAPNAPVLVAARVAQGAGAAAMFASTTALLHLTYRGRDRAVAFGVWGAVTGAAAAAGPVVGGLLTEHLGWRTIFLVNVPVSAVAAVLAVFTLAESRDRATRQLDLPGLVTFTTAAGTLTYGLIQAGERGWTAAGTPVWLATAAVALTGFVVIERRRREPMLDLGLLRNPAFTGILVAALLVAVAAFGYSVYTSLWLQDSLGLDAVGAGLALLPMSGAAFVTSAATARRLVGVAPDVPVGLGLALVGLGGLAQSRLDAGSSWPTIIPGLVVAGIGVGLCLPSLTHAAMAAVPARHSGMAAAALTTMRQLGFALGIAALGTVFASRLRAHSLTDRAEASAALGTTMLVAGCVGVVGATLVVALTRGAANGDRPSRDDRPTGGSRSAGVDTPAVRQRPVADKIRRADRPLTDPR